MKSGCGRDRVSDAVLSDTLDSAVVIPCRLDWFNTQKGSAQWNRDDRVSLAADSDASPGSSPVHFRHWVTAGSAHETGDAAVDDTLITR